MSLSVLNEGREELAQDYKAFLAKGWVPVRTIIAATQGLAEDEANVLRKRMYDAYGRRIHLEGHGRRAHTPTASASAGGAVRTSGCRPLRRSRRADTATPARTHRATSAPTR